MKEVKAIHKYAKISPFKVRLIADIRFAISQLKRL